MQRDLTPVMAHERNSDPVQGLCAGRVDVDAKDLQEKLRREKGDGVTAYNQSGSEMRGCINIPIGINILLDCGNGSSARARGSNGGSGLARPIFKAGKHIGGHRHLHVA